MTEQEVEDLVLALNKIEVRSAPQAAGQHVGGRAEQHRPQWAYISCCIGPSNQEPYQHATNKDPAPATGPAATQAATSNAAWSGERRLARARTPSPYPLPPETTM
jgi:hypothetical protein